MWTKFQCKKDHINLYVNYYYYYKYLKTGNTIFAISNNNYLLLDTSRKPTEFEIVDKYIGSITLLFTQIV